MCHQMSFVHHFFPACLYQFSSLKVLVPEKRISIVKFVSSLEIYTITLEEC